MSVDLIDAILDVRITRTCGDKRRDVVDSDERVAGPLRTRNQCNAVVLDKLSSRPAERLQEAVWSVQRRRFRFASRNGTPDEREPAVHEQRGTNDCVHQPTLAKAPFVQSLNSEPRHPVIIRDLRDGEVNKLPDTGLNGDVDERSIACVIYVSERVPKSRRNRIRGGNNDIDAVTSLRNTT